MALLMIVARQRLEHFAFLKREFAEEEAAGHVRILFDRRHGQRRQHSPPSPDDRRRGDRRHPSEIDDDLRTLGWAVAQAAQSKEPTAGHQGE